MSTPMPPIVLDQFGGQTTVVPPSAQAVQIPTAQPVQVAQPIPQAAQPIPQVAPTTTVIAPVKSRQAFKLEKKIAKLQQQLSKQQQKDVVKTQKLAQKGSVMTMGQRMNFAKSQMASVKTNKTALLGIIVVSALISYGMFYLATMRECNNKHEGKKGRDTMYWTMMIVSLMGIVAILGSVMFMVKK